MQKNMLGSSSRLVCLLPTFPPTVDYRLRLNSPSTSLPLIVNEKKVFGNFSFASSIAVAQNS
jgi:hypothetical protein